MSSIKLKEKTNTFKKLDAILSASKLKVVNRMSKFKLEANHYYVMSLFSKNIFEKAFELYQFDSEVYRNKFTTDREIFIVFLESKQTLSAAREQVTKKFLASYDERNYNLIITDEKELGEAFDGLKFKLISNDEITSMSHEIVHRYVTKKYKRVNIISSLDNQDETTTILPMCELKQVAEYKYDALLKAEVNFLPSLDVVIERAFLDYVKCLIKYYHTFGQYSTLRNTLLKHENSLDALDKKITELQKEVNKMRQTKITSEILEASEVVSG